MTNLALDRAIDEARALRDVEFVYDDIEKEHGADVAITAIAKHWRAKQLLLNNAFSLLQQSLEIALKAKIAEVSPFLLIAGDPRSWPKPKDAVNTIDFSNFRTIGSEEYWRDDVAFCARQITAAHASLGPKVAAATARVPADAMV